MIQRRNRLIDTGEDEKTILHLSSANSGSFSMQYQEYLLLHFPF